VHGVDYTVILFTSVVLALIGYIGDLFLLPRLGNVLTTLSDFLIAFLIVWGIGTYLFDYDIGTQNYKANLVPLFEISLTIGIFYAVVDWFYHRWLFKFLGKKEVFPR
jgi:UDP-N-acetylmuramyl pentapeptide phosphotransferase/UDP-N-acetylglucosamine-1-phosphate transferase